MGTAPSLTNYFLLSPGAYFGELSMLTSQRRTATARAAMDCILFYMTFEGFEDAVADYPHYLEEILEKAIVRLESTLQSQIQVSSAKEKVSSTLLPHETGPPPSPK